MPSFLFLRYFRDELKPSVLVIKSILSAELIHEVTDAVQSISVVPLVVFTGGEPTMQLTDDEEVCAGRERAMETNGILLPL